MKQDKVKCIKTQQEKDYIWQIIFKVGLTFLFVSLFLMAFILGNGKAYFYDTVYVSKFINQPFQFHTINIVQGDSFLIKFPDDKTMLVDTGENDNYPVLKSYLKQYFKNEKLNQIDYFVLTHQDSDHLGSADLVLRDFKVNKVFRPKVKSLYEKENSIISENYEICETESYNNFTITLHQKNINYAFSERGIVLSGGGYKVEFLSPSEDKYSYSNDYSAVLMITYQDKKFLLMGDATTQIEDELKDFYQDNLKADVLKLAHHGSKTSTSESFLDIVKPKYAILSVGKNNSNLPSSDVINRLNDKKIPIYSTQKEGNFAFCIQNGNIVQSSEEGRNKTLPFLASLLIIGVSLVWGIKFKKKENGKSANMIVENNILC